jgi:probable F420-dependent oxidoreductase
MKFGVQHAIGDTRWTPEIFLPDTVTTFAQRAEAVGFDLLAFTDHPAPSGRWVDQGGEGTADPFVSLAYCAAVTTSIRLLTFVMVPSYRNPFLAAHQVATLDRLSGGRLTVGLGTGYLFGEFKALGADPSRRRDDLDQLLEVWRQGFAGGDMALEGPGFSARDARILPPPLQHPHPPLWIHGNSPFGVQRAARFGQGWIAMFTTGDAMAASTRTRALPDLDSLESRIGELHAATEQAGRDPEDLEIVIAGPFGMLDVRDNFNPEKINDDLGRLDELGVDCVVSLTCGDDVQASLDTLDAFGAEVIAKN